MAKVNSIKAALAVYVGQCLDDKVKIKGKNEACTAILLFHVDAVDHREDIHMVGIGGGQDAEEISELLYDRATSHASGYDSKQNYEIAFVYGSDEKPRKPYRFPIISQVARGEHGIEEATAKGLVKTAMQDSREVMRMCFAQMNVMAENANAMVEASTQQMRELNEKLKLTKEERDAAIDYIVVQRHAAESRSHEYRMAELEKQNKNETMRTIAQYAPALINTIAKKDVLPQYTADTALIKGLLSEIEKINVRQPGFAESLLGELSPAIAAPLMSRAIQLRDEEMELKKKNAEALEKAGSMGLKPETPIGLPNGPVQVAETEQ